MGYVHYADRELRDQRIRDYKESDPTLTVRQIAELVGCSSSTVSDVFNPAARARANETRRKHNTSEAGLARQRSYRARRTRLGADAGRLRA